MWPIKITPANVFSLSIKMATVQSFSHQLGTVFGRQSPSAQPFAQRVNLEVNPSEGGGVQILSKALPLLQKYLGIDLFQVSRVKVNFWPSSLQINGAFKSALLRVFTLDAAFASPAKALSSL